MQQLDQHYMATVQILNLLRSNDSDRVWGLVGPGDNPIISDFIAPISANSGLLMVSFETLC